MISQAKILWIFNLLFNCQRGWAKWLELGGDGSEYCACSRKVGTPRWALDGCLLELPQAAEGSVQPWDRQAGSRSISCTLSSMSSCHSPTRALTVCVPACTQQRPWCGVLTSQLYAQLCCNRNAVALVRTRKPVAGGFWRSRLVPVMARQDHGQECRAPWEDLTCMHWLMFLAGWSLVSETSGVLVGPGRCAEVSRLPAQSGSGHHSLQKWAVLWYGLFVSNG